jgi:hypothetical protein
MDALARHYIGQRNAGGQNPDAHFAIPGLGAPFFDHPKRIGSAIVRDDDARVFH